MSQVKRIFVEKKKGYDIAAELLYSDLKEYLNLVNLTRVRILNRYDIEGISSENYAQIRDTILSEPPVDYVYEENLELSPEDQIIALEYLPGQYDQRADSATQCMQIISPELTPVVKTARIIILKGKLVEDEILKVKNYLINPVDSREATLIKPESLKKEEIIPDDVPILTNFTTMSDEQVSQLIKKLGLAMSYNDLIHCQRYFKEIEKRDPTLTEIKMLDTYWSDHCRHTTFLSPITSVDIIPHHLTTPIRESYETYLEARKYVYDTREKPTCLMDIALMGMKELKKRGILDNLEESDEINACNIIINAQFVEGPDEEWLVMFKNETHNHPTEIEPFGGAATCLGGAIRDPLSGRSFVYQAMRITGCGNPLRALDETIPGKLPQRQITVESAQGYSSYGNQIGLATGIVKELYNDGYLAKRMEIGAVIGAAPRKNVMRKKPVPGDQIILVGGRTGRDGCGGATGSSKSHTKESITTCGAEVQKGNPPTERKIQRLFRNPEVSKLIKKCNDFGAGGVSIAIGELADGLTIDLDAVPKKYEGLDGTELAISESQERMAVLIASHDVDRFIAHARKENLEATPVATVTAEPRVKISWRQKYIVDISREFIDTNGVIQTSAVKVMAPDERNNFFTAINPDLLKLSNNPEHAWSQNLADLNVCSQIGLIERFDSTIGAASVLLPLGGIHQKTPAESMVAKLPCTHRETKTGTIMSYGFNPKLAQWSPFHGAAYAVIEAVSKVVAAGGDHRRIRLSLQEYFEKLGDDPIRWGKPFSALLGAFFAQKQFSIPAIGGKDSMSGTFENLSVPPTLVAFAVCPTDVSTVISPEFKQPGNNIVYIRLKRKEDELPDFTILNKQYTTVSQLIKQKKILAAHTVNNGGIAATITKMAFGNLIGFRFSIPGDPSFLFSTNIGSLIVEIDHTVAPEDIFSTIEYQVIGKTIDEPYIYCDNYKINLAQALQTWESPLESVFPTQTSVKNQEAKTASYNQRNVTRPLVTHAQPRVLIPVFPGTNCEYDSARVFEQVGAITKNLVFRNVTSQMLTESLDELVTHINNSQIIMLVGGFSAGDEPDGSAKFIAAVFRNLAVIEAINNFLNTRDGLMLGICNGFQALLKLGLLPFGQIRRIDQHCPTLTFNTLGRHCSHMVTTRISSILSPWLNKVNLNDLHTIPVSHGEGRFVADDQVFHTLFEQGQIATQYVNLDGQPTLDIKYNPNGSLHAVEGITSPDGRIFGKMGHSERIGRHVAKNISGNKNQEIFAAGVEYFRT